MELQIIRNYHKQGTNGTLLLHICNTIELPWLGNRRNISCIPEGRYELKRGMTQKRGLHIRVQQVPDRSAILIHPANDALRELKGCIAPVTVLTGPGKGQRSRLACAALNELVATAWSKNEKVFLTIKSQQHETS